MEFGVLGPLSASGPGGPVDLKGPRHRAVLARLLVAKGRVVPVSRLVDDLWPDPPAGAVGAVQSFVFTLRRALEPDRPARTPPRLLVTAAPGYALATGAVDATRFEAAVHESRDRLAAGDPAAALASAEAGLALWRGPAYPEFADEPWARGEVSRLDELRLLAVERRAEAVLALGRPAEAVADLAAHLAGLPWRESAWRLLALALYRSGRQADALAALRRAKRALADDLGVDPGPGLRRLEADILAHAPHLAGPVAPHPVAPSGRSLFGRDAELARSLDAAGEVGARRRLGVVLVSGEAGAGKTALVEELAARLAGWTAWWSRHREQGGGRLLPDHAGPDRRRALVEHLSAAPGPLLLVVDDLHWAGEDVLALLTSLVAEPVELPVLVVGTYRSTEVSGPLGEALARLARAEPARVHLGGLPEPDLARLVRATARRDVDDVTARAIHRRSGGNPFFARELARLLADEGVEVLSAVPRGVRDVIRRRVGGLPPEHRQVLRQAAVLGRDVDLDVLVALVGAEDVVLDAVESARASGFLTERGPDVVRFSHDLVRDTLYADIPASRRSRWHAAVAEAVTRDRADDVETIAHHYVRAESRATAEKAAHYARAAAERAERRFAPHEAVRWWRDALAAHDRAQRGPGSAGSPGHPARGAAGTSHGSSPTRGTRARLAVVMGHVRALAVTGELAAARRLRAEALTAAEEIDDPELTAAVLGSFDVPAIWTGNDDQELADQVVAVAERTLAALAPDRLAERARLLATLALELRGAAGGRGGEAAREAEGIARWLDDPALLAFALNGRFMQSFTRAGLAPERVRVGRDLLAVSTRHGLVAFEVLAHLVLLQAHSALGEFTAADEHAAAVDRLAEHHELPLVGVFTGWYAALRASVAGRDADARAAYRAAADRLDGTGMAGLEAGIRPFALLCHGIQAGSPVRVDLAEDWGPYRPWALALGLLDAGRPAEARAAVRDSPRDLLYEARTWLTGVVALGLGDRDLMGEVYTALRPAAGELAGAGSGLLTLGPVAGLLGRLAGALGRPDDAATHSRQAREVARKAGAARWENAPEW
ncbi:BTAD domain-containing putative transcriptional regulator [Actinosynnema sp. NPDC023587]|uniref:BTAD domain-containing putative transcriptional regulator n=1 Tax=Actinosynnema sp. NPDC023587 TaxID=3154695 RepID=UPI0033E3182D